MIKLQKENLKFIIPIFSIIVLLLIVLTLSLKNNDITKLTKISKEIVNINTSLKDAIENDALNHNKACEVLKNNIQSFNTLNSELSNIKFKKTSSQNLRKSLSDYTNLNINLYNSALDILNNQEIQDFSNLYKNLIINEKNVLTTSNDPANSQLKISFPKSANTFFVVLNKYINTLYKSNREKDITDSQKLDFLLYTNSIFSDFSKLKEDVQTALVKIREDNRDLSVLLDDINNKRSIFSDIKNKSYSVSIPSGAQDCYTSLEDVLNSYEVYLNSLESSVKNEIASSKEDKNYKRLTDINKNYTDTFDKYSAFISYFDTFKNCVSDYKNK